MADSCRSRSVHLPGGTVEVSISGSTEGLRRQIAEAKRATVYLAKNGPKLQREWEHRHRGELWAYALTSRVRRWRVQQRVPSSGCRRPGHRRTAVRAHAPPGSESDEPEPGEPVRHRAADSLLTTIIARPLRREWRP
jgi:hypothetical protein